MKIRVIFAVTCLLTAPALLASFSDTDTIKLFNHNHRPVTITCQEVGLGGASVKSAPVMTKTVYYTGDNGTVFNDGDQPVNMTLRVNDNFLSFIKCSVGSSINGSSPITMAYHLGIQDVDTVLTPKEHAERYTNRAMLYYFEHNY